MLQGTNLDVQHKSSGLRVKTGPRLNTSERKERRVRIKGIQTRACGDNQTCERSSGDLCGCGELALTHSLDAGGSAENTASMTSTRANQYFVWEEQEAQVQEGAKRDVEAAPGAGKRAGKGEANGSRE